jgi:hypothetical protein
VVQSPHRLIVAPGFIDVFWEIPARFEAVRLLDGVTTALKLWIGTDDVDKWYAEREGRALANFGVAVGHMPIRMAVMRDPEKLPPTGDAQRRSATEAEIRSMMRFASNTTMSASASEGVRHVLVNGVLVVKDGVHQQGSRP